MSNIIQNQNNSTANIQAKNINTEKNVKYQREWDSYLRKHSTTPKHIVVQHYTQGYILNKRHKSARLMHLANEILPKLQNEPSGPTNFSALASATEDALDSNKISKGGAYGVARTLSQAISGRTKHNLSASKHVNNICNKIGAPPLCLVTDKSDASRKIEGNYDNEASQLLEADATSKKIGKKFHLFPLLPTELRTKIYRMALEPHSNTRTSFNFESEKLRDIYHNNETDIFSTHDNLRHASHEARVESNNSEASILSNMKKSFNFFQEAISRDYVNNNEPKMSDDRYQAELPRLFDEQSDHYVDAAELRQQPVKHKLFVDTLKGRSGGFMALDYCTAPTYINGLDGLNDIRNIVENGSGFKIGILLDTCSVTDNSMSNFSEIIKGSSVTYLRLSGRQAYGIDGGKKLIELMSNTPKLKRVDMRDDGHGCFADANDSVELLNYMKEHNIKPVYNIDPETARALHNASGVSKWFSRSMIVGLEQGAT